MSCEEREQLIQAYLDATAANRKASYSIDEVQGPEWSKATEQTRQACHSALAALKLHVSEHKCWTATQRVRFRRALDAEMLPNRPIIS